MADPSRLAELTGIHAATDETESFWPLNVVLVLLGTAVLGVSFYFLDMHDERFIYNPWTYAIATPVALLIFSALLSAVVSRVVEKSMQMAFLLSVLVHLVLLVYAVNIVIFSRMWPEMLDSLARERHELQREALQAKQYYRISVTSQTGRKPDYLSFVPTQHQPTEVVETDSPALRLARSERANLVSPQPKVERNANPHILERSQPSPSLPADSEQAASLSRSELTQQLEQQTLPEQFDAREETPIQALRPSESVPQRELARSSNQLRPDAATLTIDLPSSTPELQRADIPTPSIPAISPAELSATDSSMPRRRKPSDLPAAITRQIAEPGSQVAGVRPPTPLPLNRRSDSTVRDRTESPSNPLPAAMLDARLPKGMQPKTDFATNRIRKELEYRVPDPSAGDTSASLARQTAGGTTGPPAPSSVPLFNPDTVVGGDQVPNLPSTPRMSLERRSIGARRAQSTSGVELSQAPRWDNRPSLSAGVSGLSPSLLSNKAASGYAATQDNADLSGASQAIERSSVGLSASRGPVAVPSLSDLAISDTSTGVLPANTRKTDPSLSANASELARTVSPTRDLGALSELEPSKQAVGLGSDVQLERATGLVESRPQPTFGSESGFRDGLRKSRELSRTPTGGGVPTADSSPQNSIATGDGISPVADRISRSSRGAARSTLDIDMPIGPGGISPLPDRVGLLLPRRSTLVGDRALVDLDAQRYARQQVGGPLAAGQQAALPKPAFQQRLERLQDSMPLDTTTIEPQTELAIERGLSYLAKHQRDDGSWRLQDFDTEVLMRSDTAATGLALLAFQGAGYTHQQFRYADTVDRAIQFLRRHQTAVGDLYIPQDPASDQNAKLYSHGIAALALCEAYGMTQDPELKEPAQRSIDFMVASQDPSRGGWRYQPGRGTDTSVTGWFMMALKSGQLAGLEVPEKTFARIRVFLEQSQLSASQPHLYRYNPFAADTQQQRHGLEPTAVMTSVGLLMRLYLGWQRDRAEMLSGTDYLLQHLPEEGTQRNSRRDTYYWYYATQVLFHMGGDRWQRWHDELYPLLIENQRTSGEHEGSWDPLLPTPDLWARYGGRLYVTTMNLLSLEVSYRHLPLYDATGYDPLKN